MDKFAILSSGSSGNCLFIEYKGSKILVDAGFSARKIENLLINVNCIFTKDIFKEISWNLEFQ